MGVQNINQKRALINEIEAFRRFEGCGVIELYEVHETDKNIYLVSEFSKNDSLELIMKSLGSSYLLSRMTIQQIMFEVLKILSTFASRGVIHRNIKPFNIIIEDEANIKISNFGLATCKSAPLASLRICGTPGYIAPEVINLGKRADDQSYNEKCDVFAAGCIFFEMLFGIPIFDEFRLGSKSINKVTMENIEEFVFMAAALRRDRTNHDGLNLLLKLLQFDPNHRISADEALRHPFFKTLYYEVASEDDKAAEGLLMVSPVSAIRHVTFKDAVDNNQIDSERTACEEDTDISDEELDLSIKWNSLNSKNFQKHPSKNYTLF